jgi:isopentenyl diphosphate isomerase/L-lactate dehydrogenase-like FMN-dependent dehydrogenase
MADLVPQARRLGGLAPAGVLLDVAPLADHAPFGEVAWRPRRREELAELRAAVGRPLWLDGVASPADAEVAAEAGLDGIVVRSTLGRRLGGPAVAEVLPEILDTVAGMLGVHVGGPVRDGIDVFRYLALGADTVLPDAGAEVRRLTAELAYAMRMTGCETLEDVGYEALFAPLWEENG